MSVRIVLEMPKIRLVLRYQPAKKFEHIALHVGVGIFIYGQTAGRMLNEQYDNTAAARQQFLHLRGYVDHFLALGR